MGDLHRVDEDVVVNNTLHISNENGIITLSMLEHIVVVAKAAHYEPGSRIMVRLDGLHNGPPRCISELGIVRRISGEQIVEKNPVVDGIVVLKTPAQWLADEGGMKRIVDPDGWRTPFIYNGVDYGPRSLDDPINQTEFNIRCSESTMGPA